VTSWPGRLGKFDKKKWNFALHLWVYFKACMHYSPPEAILNRLL